MYNPFRMQSVTERRRKKVYRLQDWAAVQRVYKQTHSKRKTAKILGISRNTVRKLLELKEEPTYSRTVYKSCLDDYKELIIVWRCEPYEFNGTRIANSHFPRPAGPHFPARQGHIKRPVLESGTGVQGREGLHPASL